MKDVGLTYALTDEFQVAYLLWRKRPGDHCFLDKVGVLVKDSMTSNP